MNTTLTAALCGCVMLAAAGCGGGGGYDDKADNADKPADKTPSTAPSGGASLPVPDGTSFALASFEGRTVKVGCAMCVYDMPGADSCIMAADIDGHKLMVAGVDHIDLHDHDLCSREGEALVSGKVENGELMVTEIEVQ